MSAKTGYGPDVNVLWHDRKRWCGLPLSFTRYRIIEKPTKWLKLIVDRGFLSRTVEEINMFRIEDVSVVETFTNRMWGTGTVTVLSKDASAPEVRLVRILNIVFIFLSSTLISIIITLLVLILSKTSFSVFNPIFFNFIEFV